MTANGPEWRSRLKRRLDRLAEQVDADAEDRIDLLKECAEKYADYQSVLRRIWDNTLKIQAAIEMQSIQRELYGDKA